jgi:hypothetical protein
MKTRIDDDLSAGDPLKMALFAAVVVALVAFGVAVSAQTAGGNSAGAGSGDTGASSATKSKTTKKTGRVEPSHDQANHAGGGVPVPSRPAEEAQRDQRRHQAPPQ